MKKTLAVYFALTFVFTSAMLAQTMEDAMRLTSQGRGVGSRPLGMGNAYIGVSDDFSATYWNPAGLAQMRRIEITGGLTHYSYDNSTAFLGQTTDDKKSATKLDNIGFAFPFPTRQGSFVIAFGYNRVADYTTALSYDGFNANSSIIPSLHDGDDTYNIPFNIYLESESGHTAITGNVNQNGVVRETGGLGNWAFAAAVDVAPDISFGLTLNVLNGSYKYERTYIEADTRNVYNNARANLPVDSAYLRFDQFQLDNVIDDNLTGINAMFGMMYRSDRFRIGLTMKTPTTLKVTETYTDGGTSWFDNGTFAGTSGPVNLQKSFYSYTADNDYSIVSPWTFGAGISVEPITGLLIAGDADYSDWTQVEWADNRGLETDPNVGNKELAKAFREVVNLRFGAEFEVPGTDLRLRGGYMINPSHFKDDPSSYDVKTITAGAGVLLQNNVLLDLGLGFGSFNTVHSNYIDDALRYASRTAETVNTTRVNFSVSYRF